MELSLPQLPEMTFGGNKLSIQHASGFGIEFNAINALRLVDAHNDLMKVAMAKEWKESRYYIACNLLLKSSLLQCYTVA